MTEFQNAINETRKAIVAYRDSIDDSHFSNKSKTDAMKEICDDCIRILNSNTNNFYTRNGA